MSEVQEDCIKPYINIFIALKFIFYGCHKVVLIGVGLCGSHDRVRIQCLWRVSLSSHLERIWEVQDRQWPQGGDYEWFSG